MTSSAAFFCPPPALHWRTEFARVYHNEDVHEVYLNMNLNTGWIGGTLQLFLVLTTLFLGFRLAMRDRVEAGSARL